MAVPLQQLATNAESPKFDLLGKRAIKAQKKITKKREKTYQLTQQSPEWYQHNRISGPH
jgi:hypothetical protein